MVILFDFHHLPIPEHVLEYTMKKMKKLEKFEKEGRPLRFSVVFGEEKYQKMVSISTRDQGLNLHIQCGGEMYQEAVDQVVKKMCRNIACLKDKKVKKQRRQRRAS